MITCDNDLHLCQDMLDRKMGEYNYHKSFSQFLRVLVEGQTLMYTFILKIMNLCTLSINKNVDIHMFPGY